MRKTRITVGLSQEALAILDDMVERNGVKRPIMLEIMLRRLGKFFDEGGVERTLWGPTELANVIRGALSKEE